MIKLSESELEIAIEEIEGMSEPELTRLCGDEKTDPIMLTKVAYTTTDYDEALVKNRSTPNQALDIIARRYGEGEEDYIYFRAIAEHKNAGVELLDKLLILTACKGVRIDIAMNPRAAIKTLYKLIEESRPMMDEDEWDESIVGYASENLKSRGFDPGEKPISLFEDPIQLELPLNL